MRPEVTANRFEISLWGKISLWCQERCQMTSGVVKLTLVQISLWSN